MVTGFTDEPFLPHRGQMGSSLFEGTGEQQHEHFLSLFALILNILIFSPFVSKD